MVFVGRIKSVLFGECFDCIEFIVCDSLYLVNSGKSSLSNFFYRLEHFVKTKLIDGFA